MAMTPFDERTTARTRVETTRRQFLLWMGGLGTLGAALFGGLELIKFMFPQASGEAPPEFTTDFGVDSLVQYDNNNKIIPTVKTDSAHRVAFIADQAGVYAVYLVCTHLGCTPNYVPDVATSSGNDAANTARAKARGERGPADSSNRIPNGWACPCHGSRYFIDSTNFFGPAPRPMDWVKVSITPDNRFHVDRSNIVVLREAGQGGPIAGKTDPIGTPLWRVDPKTGKSNDLTIP